MTWLKRFQLRFRALFAKRRLDAEMDEEMRAHVEMQTEENIDAGMSPEEARYAALREFGHTDGIKETCRDQREGFLTRHVSLVTQDLRFALRQLRKSPGFATVAVLTLALGIGANTVVFSVARTALFRPLGFEGEERLMWIQSVHAPTGDSEERISGREFAMIQDSAKSFENVAALNVAYAIWDHGDRAEKMAALKVTPGLAEVLHVRPVLGRRFLPSDAGPTAQPVVMISHELWQSQFGGTPDIIGHNLRLSRRSYTVVGVLPVGLEFPLERSPSVGTGDTIQPGVQDFWFPLRLHPDDEAARTFLAIGRLKPGVAMESANAELNVLARRLASDRPKTNRGWNLEVLSLRDQILGRTRQAILLLAAAVAAVLLICCVNLANLLLARGVARHRELAVRVALGANRRRLIQTLMTENLLLSLLGGGFGMGLAFGAIHGIRAAASANVPFISEAAVDGTVIAITAGLALLTALTFGLLPALHQSRVEPTDSLRTGTRTTGGKQIRAWQQGLLVGQIAVVLVLLAAAALLLESFRRLVGEDLGYQPQSVIALDFDTWNLPGGQDGNALYREIQSRLAALPGVEHVGTIQSTPLTGRWAFEERTRADGEPLPPADQPLLAGTFVAYDYFQAMGIPLIEGRFFREGELAQDEFRPVVILNESAARELFGVKSALGRRIRFRFTPEQSYEVIGVVRDTRDARVEERPAPRFYLSATFGGAQFLVRSSAPVAAMTPLLRDSLRQFGNRIILRDVQPLTDIVSATLAERRFLMAMLAIYATVAMGIAMVGIFGVVAYQVAQRTNEFGIRLALGAAPGGLLRMVLRQAGRLVVIGLAIGLGLTPAAGQLLANQLYGLSPHDPALLGAVCLLLFLIALLACAIPARRAARIDPMEALRCE